MIKHFVKIIAAVLAGVSLLAATGCDKKDFDASTYVQAMLDATYQGDHAKFTEMELGKESEAEKMHTDTVKALVESFEDVLGGELSEDTKTKLTDAITDLCKKTDYTIGDVTEDNGVYKVETKIRPLEFSAAFDGEAFNKRAEEVVKEAMKEKADITPDELNTVLVDLLIEQIQAMAKDPVYGDEETVTVTLKKESGLYEISSQDWEALDQVLIR